MVGDILTFRGVMAVSRVDHSATNRYREVVVIKSCNKISKDKIYPQLTDSGKYRTVVRLPTRLRVKTHSRTIS